MWGIYSREALAEPLRYLNIMRSLLGVWAEYALVGWMQWGLEIAFHVSLIQLVIAAVAKLLPSWRDN